MAVTTNFWNVENPMPRDVARAGGQLLAGAFFLDPLFVHVQPSERMRQRGLPVLFEALLRHGGHGGGVLSGKEGVVAWLPVNHLQANLIELIHRGFIKAPLCFGIAASLRLQTHDDWCNRWTQAHSDRNAAYIHCVGVEPSLAGQGIGSELMNRALSCIAQSCRICTLRTENPKNVAFYEKLGFQCVKQLQVPATGLPAWFFEREV